MAADDRSTGDLVRKMSDQLHQMNISHNGKEDRLLLRLSTGAGDECRLWLTRRYTGLLMGILNK